MTTNVNTTNALATGTPALMRGGTTTVNAPCGSRRLPAPARAARPAIAGVSVLALLLALTGPSLAAGATGGAGGAGVGDNYFDAGDGGDAGEDGKPAAGDAIFGKLGGTAASPNGKNGGAVGGNQYGGGGGAGGANGTRDIASGSITSAMTGGKGGNGGSGGGGGGAGGDGVRISGTGTIAISATIAGGAGGDGANSTNSPESSAKYVNIGGGGGAGIVLLDQGADVTVTSKVTGGAGGSHGDNVVGGGGGAGIIFEQQGTLAITGNTTSVTGGSGGIGGDGGVGVLLQSGGVVSIDATAKVTGGAGGANQNYSTTIALGGAAISAAAGSTILNAGTLQGGVGGGADDSAWFDGRNSNHTSGGTGSGGAAGHVRGPSPEKTGAGGVGILGAAEGAVTIVNSGKITGGKPVRDATGQAAVQPNAISLFGSGNRLELQAGFAITGNVVVAVGGANNVLAFGGNSNASFNAAQIAVDKQYRGFDTLEKTGASTWTLTGANSFAGTTVVEEGTLLAGNAGALASGAYVINGGTLDLGGFDLTASSLSGTGGTIASGLLATFSVDQADDTSYGGALTGSGALKKTGDGALTLTGDSSGFAGTTTVSGGMLIVGTAAGGKLGGALNVEAGGVLGGTGTIGTLGSTVTIAAGGVHAPGNSIGVQYVASDYENYGTLRIEATPTSSDKIVVAGSVDIAGATLDLVLSPTGAASWGIFNGPFTIIDNQGAGAVGGSFGSVAQNLLFLDTLLDYQGGDGNDVTLELSRNDILFANPGRTRNQIAVGTAIETLDNTDPVWQSIAFAGDADIVRASFDALSGEIHASARTALIEDSRFVRNAANDRLRAAFGDAAASVTPILAYGPGDMPVLVSPDHDGLGFWSQGFGSWGATDSDGNAAALDRQTGGLLVGGDTFVGDWRLGLLAGYSRSGFSTNTAAASVDNYHLGLYGGTHWGDVGVRTGLAYTWHDLDIVRSATSTGIADTLTTGHRAGTFQAFGELGYGIDLGDTRFEPFANLAYVNLHTDGFAEQGGTTALTGAGGTTSVTFTTLGLRAERTMSFGAADATLKGLVGWRHALGDLTPESVNAFSSGDAFTVAGLPVSGDAAIIEAGLDLTLTPGATLGLSYAGQFGRSVQDHGFKANLSVSF